MAFIGGGTEMTLKRKSFRRLAALCASVLLLTHFSYSEVAAENDYDVTVSIDVNADNIAISPYIYGINDTADVTSADYAALVQGGGLFSTYNWENNCSNSGSDDYNTNRNEMYNRYGWGLSSPAAAVHALMGKSEMYGVNYTVTTLPTMGYVAADSNGPILDGQEAPSDRWKVLEFRSKNSDINIDATDDKVYLDEYLRYLISLHGKSSEGGVSGYILDNDGSLWAERNPYIFDKVKIDDYIEKTAEAAKVVKETDPDAVVFGGGFEGMASLVDFRNESMWRKIDGEYSWFLDYYLAQMKLEEHRNSSRILDVLDIHYYPEYTTEDGSYVYLSNTAEANDIRLDYVRSLYDGSYSGGGESISRYKQFYPLFPTIQASINQYYPGTKLSVSEYDFGGGNNISGGIAQAEALGVFAEYGVYLAALNPQGYDTRYQTAAIRLFTDYDGNGSGFKDTSVRSRSTDDENTSSFASVAEDGSMTVVLINKDKENSRHFALEITSDNVYSGGNIYGFNKNSPAVKLVGTAEFVGEHDIRCTVEPMSVVIVELNARDELYTETPAETQIPEETDVPETTPPETSVAETEVPIETEENEQVPDVPHTEGEGDVPFALKVVTVILGIATAFAIAYLILGYKNIK